MYLVGVPLLLVPFAIYNLVAVLFQLPAASWGAPLAHVTLRSGADWAITPGELLIAFAILILLVELVKLTRLGVRNWVDHLLAAALFIVIAAEFLMVQAAATTTFFLLLVTSFVDVTAGILSAFAARARRKELLMGQAPPPPVRGTVYEAPSEPVVTPKPEPRPEPKLDPIPPGVEPTTEATTVPSEPRPT